MTKLELTNEILSLQDDIIYWTTKMEQASREISEAQEAINGLEDRLAAYGEYE